ncbi:SRPBCC domain-containing protein [Phytomonospora sp. NPDC050363]|uniref:SRPBCC family protein n=1 Tax=Phytomonospora sp. NPDC050363 TaxID=3155642 RepID=UPI0033F5A02D
MVDILHKVGVRSSVDEVFKALTTADGLAGWWTTDTSGVGDTVGGRLEFRFGDLGGFDMKVVELVPDEKVLWEVIDGPEEWVGTHVGFDLSQSADYASVQFKHAGWKEPVMFMHHCSTKWAVFLMSLKAMIETGKGAPAPNDVKIDDFN